MRLIGKGPSPLICLMRVRVLPCIPAPAEIRETLSPHPSARGRAPGNPGTCLRRSLSGLHATAADGHALGWLRSRRYRCGPDAGLRVSTEPGPDGAVKSSTSYALLVHFSSTSGGPAGSAAGDRAGSGWRLRARSGCRSPRPAAGPRPAPGSANVGAKAEEVSRSCTRRAGPRGPRRSGTRRRCCG